MPRASCPDALELVLCLGRADDANFQRACARWVSHFQQTKCDALEAELLRASLAAVADMRPTGPAETQARK